MSESIIITEQDFTNHNDDDIFCAIQSDIDKKIYIESKLFLTDKLNMINNDELIRYLAIFSTIDTVGTTLTYYIDNDNKISSFGNTNCGLEPILFDFFLPDKIVEIRVYEVGDPYRYKIELVKKYAWRGLASSLRKKYLKVGLDHVV